MSNIDNDKNKPRQIVGQRSGAQNLWGVPKKSHILSCKKEKNHWISKVLFE